ncbi:MAG: 16S rRNA (adenine(1518)-N(6)/adenine(1519)-N(6))-dimethyltransferase RsmA [Holosporales bacterium]|jgi:16S rRNA (adenine1518-N6/adenine1519-N6)-dimethyltransferase|nr:16S rRNA (adenine(1518)-N(6)/adenine(1519)-N(6))-dimethyltransferase RsmA [Holosporales bacterium]
MSEQEDNDLNLTIKQVIDKYDLLGNKSRAKAFGQHFLCDLSLLRKIALCAAPYDDCDIIEIGPGPCGLTRAILELSKENNKVYCIEKDKNLENVHKNIVRNYNNLVFIYADALLINIHELTKKDIIIISNLPYNVSTQLLVNWLLNIKNMKKMILTFQKEVAQRICAPINTKLYGRLSIISQLLCHTEKLFDISNKAFYPPPKVLSSVVKLTPLNVNITNINELEKLIAICFQQRRKTIFSILKSKYENIEEILRKCNIDKLSRPENISPGAFLELAIHLGSRGARV